MYHNDKYLEKNPTWHEEDSSWKASKIMKMLSQNSLEPKSILDVGCGFGGVASCISKNFPFSRVLGIDFTETSISYAKHKGSENLDFSVNELDNLTEDFELLLCIDVLEHVETYTDFLRSIRRVSQYQVFHVPLDLSVNALVRNLLVSSRRDVGHVNYYHLPLLLEVLNENGFEILDHTITMPFEVDGLVRRGWKSAFGKVIRRISYIFAPNASRILFGGSSALVLTKVKR